jgi:hypothetical protein
MKIRRISTQIKEDKKAVLNIGCRCSSSRKRKRGVDLSNATISSNSLHTTNCVVDCEMRTQHIVALINIPPFLDSRVDEHPWFETRLFLP